ncbi:disease resistance-like protein DSC1 [Neltuma alba]|uniref:disease resistance-like protein DSC1 n=1 Tax=Neltuma alba TaxID=207710 RepID=UPI0010A36950|nr:disease resistance-like protein DSC1 [Prosopis alba]
MERAANLSSWLVPCNPCPEVIDDFVRVVSKKICQLVYVDLDLVGMESRVKEVEELLDLNTKDAVRVVAICGMGGIGKTTLATVLYDRISHRFDASHFLLNVSEFDMNTEGKSILIVLDGVDIYQKLQPLIQTIDDSLLGGGSRIILTTRDEGILKVFKMHDIYRVKLLTGHEAVQLFCRKVFKCDFPIRDYEEHIDSVLKYVSGLPLVTVKLGSFLYNRRASEWSTALVEFKKVASLMIMKVLRSSFLELDFIAKETF